MFIRNVSFALWNKVPTQTNLITRFYSVITSKYNFDLPQEEIQPFFSITPEIIKDITENKVCNSFSDLRKRAVEIIEYSSIIGDVQCPITTVGTYKILEQSDKLTKENISLAYLLGWFTEMVQSVLHMQRDTIDNNCTRNNRKTWNTNPELSLYVSNDAVILESSIFLLLKKYFSKHTNYLRILDLFHESIYHSLQGNNLELISKDLEKFNMTLLENISKYKQAPIAYLLPIKSAWYLTDVQEFNDEEEVHNILNNIALFKEVESDYFDSIDENPKILKHKFGICSWLAVKALEKSNEDQKVTLKEHYGKSVLTSIKAINNLYKELNLKAEFDDFKNEQSRKIRERIQTLNDDALKRCLIHITEKILN